MAERIIAYKKKISEVWLEKKQNKENIIAPSDSESESDGEPVKKEMVLTKINKKQFNYFLLIYIMFNKTEYKLLIEEYMDKYDITYTSAKQLICNHQIKQIMMEKKVSYEMACIADDIINNYNLSIL